MYRACSGHKPALSPHVLAPLRNTDEYIDLSSRRKRWPEDHEAGNGLKSRSLPSIKLWNGRNLQEPLP